MPSPESASQLSLTVGTRLYAKKECRIMVSNKEKSRRRINQIGGIPIAPGSIVEILKIEDNAARIQLYGDNGRELGIHWYDLDKFSPDTFGIDHRNPNRKSEQSMSRERATELLVGEGTKRSTDTGETVLEVARAAHKKLTGRDEI